MGYRANSIEHGLIRLIDQGVLFPGCSILEFGAQTLEGDLEEALTSLKKFALSLKVSNVEGLFSDISLPIDMGHIFSLLEFKYHSIDVNNLYKSTFFDLNTQKVPISQLGQYDWVNNEGTTEHILNQLNGFRVAHDYCKVGGYISHSCPIIGWVDHGFVNLTPKFWAQLIGYNNYKIIDINLDVNTSDRPLPEWYSSWLKEPSKDFTYPDVWLKCLLQKKEDKPFVTPLDHLETDRNGDIARRLQDMASIHGKTYFQGSHQFFERKAEKTWLSSIKRPLGLRA